MPPLPLTYRRSTFCSTRHQSSIHSRAENKIGCHSEAYRPHTRSSHRQSFYLSLRATTPKHVSTCMYQTKKLSYVRSTSYKLSICVQYLQTSNQIVGLNTMLHFLENTFKIIFWVCKFYCGIKLK